jgi:hypothetical protein
MGLDMYLHRKTYVKNWDHAPEEKHEITVKLNGEQHPFIDVSKIVYIEEEVGYWRKANSIHRWFVENCQQGVDDCKGYYVDPTKLVELLELCKKIQADHSKKNLLPPQGGFFFGPTDDDEWYFKDIENTINQLEPLVKLQEEIDAKGKAGERIYDYPEYEYRSSW